MARRASANADPSGTSGSVAQKPSRPAVRVVQLEHAQGLALPAYASSAAAGADLVAAVADGNPIRLEPGARALVPTGIVIELGEGFEAQVRPRSGLALRHGVTVLNSPGTIDADYRGEVHVLLVNHGDTPFDIARGERIAQLVVAPVAQVTFVAVEALTSTDRGAGGFGSTGTGAIKAKVAMVAAAPRTTAPHIGQAGKRASTGARPKAKSSNVMANSKRGTKKR